MSEGWAVPGRVAAVRVARASALAASLAAGWLAIPALAQAPAAMGPDAAATPAPAVSTAAGPSNDGDVAHLKVQLEGVDEEVDLKRSPSGNMVFELQGAGGQRLRLTPEQFADRVYEEQTRLEWWERLLNITSPWGVAWVALGLLGQLLFTGRMLLQWLASERQRASVVPPAFWWLSLVGATMLLVYFVWRQDVVGVLGQATGWIVYGRNLWLIYRGGPKSLPLEPVEPVASNAPP